MSAAGAACGCYTSRRARRLARCRIHANARREKSFAIIAICCRNSPARILLQNASTEKQENLKGFSRDRNEKFGVAAGDCPQRGRSGVDTDRSRQRPREPLRIFWKFISAVTV